MSQIDDLQAEIQERSVSQEGTRQTLSKRLFMQLQVYGNCRDTGGLVEPVKRSGLECVLYQDVNDPRGIGILSMSEDPAVFVSRLKSLLTTGPFQECQPKPDFTMLGRSYAVGYEQDLEDWPNIVKSGFGWHS